MNASAGQKRILIAAGGSGGHIFPAVAFAGEIEKLGVSDIYFVASKRKLDRNMLEGVGHPCFFLSINPMPFGRDPFKWLAFVFKFLADMAMSFSLLLRTHPHVVVGFGGYSSGAVLKTANILNIPVVIHEQNLVPGRANILLGKKARMIGLSFKETEGYFKDTGGRLLLSGNPIRVDRLMNDREKASEYMGLKRDLKTVLVMGGSQGSTFLNRTASKAAQLITRSSGGGVQFIHLAGKNDFDEVKDFYAQNNIPGKVFSFLDRMDYAYSICDLAITRSGAAALFELAYYAKPMILIPYPNIKNSQWLNADYFAGKGAAVVMREKEISEETLAGEVLKMLNDGARLGGMSRASEALAMPDAGEKLAKAVVSLVE